MHRQGEGGPGGLGAIAHSDSHGMGASVRRRAAEDARVRVETEPGRQAGRRVGDTVPVGVDNQGEAVGERLPDQGILVVQGRRQQRPIAGHRHGVGLPEGLVLGRHLDRDDVIARGQRDGRARRAAPHRRQVVRALAHLHGGVSLIHRRGDLHTGDAVAHLRRVTRHARGEYSRGKRDSIVRAAVGAAGHTQVTERGIVRLLIHH